MGYSSQDSNQRTHPMQFNTLNQFRHDAYACFQRAPDALFEACDALLTEPAAHSFVELSLSPRFRRKWPSLYAAFKDGQIDRTALKRTFAQYVAVPAAECRLLLGVDTTGLPRPESPTAADRTYLYVHNLPKAQAAATLGWTFSTVVVLPDPASSWTYILDNQRMPSDHTAGQMAAAQLCAVVPVLPVRPVVTADRHYGSAKFVQALAGIACDQLLRIPRNRVFYRPAPRRKKGQRGASKKDGKPFKCRDARTHGQATAAWQGCDDQGHRIEVTAWSGLHFKRCRSVTLTVIRVVRHGASGKKRDPRVSWFIWVGATLLPLQAVWPMYRRRYGQEHGYRFDKQDLLWLDPHLRTPEQMQRWTDIQALAHNQLVLARSEAAGVRQAWESAQRPPTPRQVRRAMGRILGQLGTPTQPPQPRGKAPGRRRGAKIKRARRYQVVYKAKKRTRKVRLRR